MQCVDRKKPTKKRGKTRKRRRKRAKSSELPGGNLCESLFPKLQLLPALKHLLAEMASSSPVIDAPSCLKGFSEIFSCAHCALEAVGCAEPPNAMLAVFSPLDGKNVQPGVVVDARDGGESNEPVVQLNVVLSASPKAVFVRDVPREVRAETHAVSQAIDAHIPVKLLRNELLQGLEHGGRVRRRRQVLWSWYIGVEDLSALRLVRVC